MLQLWVGVFASDRRPGLRAVAPTSGALPPGMGPWRHLHDTMLREGGQLESGARADAALADIITHGFAIVGEDGITH